MCDVKHSRFRTVLGAAAALLLAVTLAGSCGSWHWVLDLASHFRAYWLMGSAVCLALATRQSRWPALACCGLAVAGNTWALLPFWLPASGGPPTAFAAEPGAPEAVPPLSLILANVHRLNPDKSQAVAYLRDRQPDVAVILEVDAGWRAHLESLDEIYPHRMVEPREDNFGIAILSRWPLTDSRVVRFGGSPFPNVTAMLRFHGRDVRLFATHPHPPFNAALAATQLAQLGALADAAAASTAPCIVAGDFNATPWSAPYRLFVTRSGCRDTALGFGVQPTWNARGIAPRIPIDHVFVSPDVAILQRSVGPDVGSDHFPVEATLVLPP